MEKWKTRFEIRPNKWVYVPLDITAEYGRKVLGLLSNKWSLPPFYYHVRKGGHLEATRVHIERQFFCVIDLKSFFESISPSRITRVLKAKLGYKLARKIALESTVRSPNLDRKHIPFGFIQSPLLATICLSESYLGHELAKLNKNQNMTISVYMDDILVSSDDFHLLSSVYEALIDSINRSHFEINESKTKPPSMSVNIFNLNLSYQTSCVNAQRMKRFYEQITDAQSGAVVDSIWAYIGQAEDLLNRPPSIL